MLFSSSLRCVVHNSSILLPWSSQWTMTALSLLAHPPPTVLLRQEAACSSTSTGAENTECVASNVDPNGTDNCRLPQHVRWCLNPKCACV